ncbi:hypothetical protein BpHYR1_026145 [Brachionus plicatilis]|uniref:Uncharacterized protein n=1 Tax=Brachionus plicatilis TaxID=10195 RepID=A0A3M7T7N4_BRAPC|nr:hypothetical protein BpHYR1_026145 [Brachionus plicatilis]
MNDLMKKRSKQKEYQKILNVNLIDKRKTFLSKLFLQMSDFVQLADCFSRLFDNRQAFLSLHQE